MEGRDHKVSRPSFLPLFTQVRGETVWKIGIGAESGFRRRPRGGKEAQLGRFLESKKHGREVLGYFPNSFGRDLLRSSPLRSSRLLFVKRRRARLPVNPPGGS